MSKPIISAEQIGKCYRIGEKNNKHYTTLRDAVVNGARGLVRRFRDGNDGISGGAAEFWALRGVNFEVNQGEVVGLIGRNGAGKSTLLKVLSRITEPTEGRAVMRGRVASLLEVGTGFHPELTGRENIYLNGSILGMRKVEIDRKFDEIVAFSEVEKFLETPVKRYSSGMYVRLAFAVAAHLEPEILIVDEVLAVGDAQFQKKCLGKMGDVVKQGRTVLFVSHNMDAVLNLCTSALLIKGGRSSERMSPAEGVKEYLAQNADNPSEPLAKRPRFQHRERPPIFVDLKSEGASGHGNVVECGGAMTFEVTCADCDDIREAAIGVCLNNDRGQRVAFFHSEYCNARFFKGGSRKTFVCHVPSVPLPPATYAVELVFVDKGDNSKIIERVERADHINVIFHDYLGTGKLPNQHQCQVVLPCDWQEKA